MSHLVVRALRYHGPVPLDTLQHRVRQLHFSIDISRDEALMLGVDVFTRQGEIQQEKNKTKIGKKHFSTRAAAAAAALIAQKLKKDSVCREGPNNRPNGLPTRIPPH